MRSCHDGQARLILNSVLQALPKKAARVIKLGDSAASIAALELRTASLAQYFANQNSEISTWDAISDIKT